MNSEILQYFNALELWYSVRIDMDFIIRTGQMIDIPKPHYVCLSGHPSSITHGTNCLVLVIATYQAKASIVKSTVFWDTMRVVLLKSRDVSGEHIVACISEWDGVRIGNWIY
jgi:hypothetical protein